VKSIRPTPSTVPWSGKAGANLVTWDRQQYAAHDLRDPRPVFAHRVRVRAEQHQHEHEEDDHGSRVHDELNRGEELRGQLQEEPGNADDGGEQTDGAPHRIARDHRADRADDAGDAAEDEEKRPRAHSESLLVCAFPPPVT
jgi:hypothetical protein